MLIHEAVKAATAQAPCIRRLAWIRPSPSRGVAVKILPTNSPDGCILYSTARNIPCCGWQPTAEDLIADDWEPVYL